MTSAIETLKDFLKEKARVYTEANARLASVYEKHLGDPILRQASAFLLRDPLKATFETVQESNTSATIVTAEPAPHGSTFRQRYHLKALGDIWKIIRMERECVLCQGTGVAEDVSCPRCKGIGWCDRPRSDLVTAVTERMERSKI